MTNLYYKLNFNIRNIKKTVYANIKIRETTLVFSGIIYDYDNELKKYVNIRNISSRIVPNSISNFIIYQIVDIYGINFVNVEIEEITRKLFKTFMK